MRRWIATAAIAIAGALAGSAFAHELSMAEMQVRQLSDREFLWQWTETGNRPANAELQPRWPEGCADEAGIVRCGPQGLSGTLAVDGVGRRYSAALVRISWRDGGEQVYTITTGQPTARLFGSSQDRRGFGEIAGAYAVLGVEHILSGWDHLLFVLALLFLVGFNRRLLWTITAFTAAHSVTLALSALDAIALRPPPVEAAIALSIVLVASEALNPGATLARRWPALVAFLFGLVHGLGFAGALKEIGLPQSHIGSALLTFNLGVEAGQLAVVALAFALCRAAARVPRLALARVPALYSIGAIAAFWSMERIAAILV